MAYPYPKPDPKNAKNVRWYGRVKIAGRIETVSLNMKVAGNKKEAERRVQRLQQDVDAGALSKETTAWLKPAKAKELERKLGVVQLIPKTSHPMTWNDALQAYLRDTEAQDTREPVPGKTRVAEWSKVSRRNSLTRLVRWAEEEKIPFQGQPYTDSLIAYIKHRRAKGIKLTTIYGAEYPYGMLWGEWLYEQGLHPKPDRDRVKKVIPPKPTPQLNLPEWRVDLEMLKFFFENRDAHDWGGQNWQKGRRYWSAWLVVLVIRGLGCRPSEAYTLTWRDVHLDEDRPYVHFRSRKTGKNSDVPIILKWVHDGLAEAKSKHKWKGDLDTPVCHNTRGQAYQFDCCVNGLLSRVIDYHKLPEYLPKKMQKLQLNQLINEGFPPDVVASWADHTLPVQERHYYEQLNYAPSMTKRDYGYFGEMSPYGQWLKNYMAGWSRLPSPV